MNQKRMMIWAVMLPILGGVFGYALNPAHDRHAPKAPPPPAVTTTAPSPEASPPPAGPKPQVATSLDLAAWRFALPSGEKQALSRWAGKTLVINFWATWCTPCIKEMPAFVALQKKYEGKGVQFVGLALDDAESVKTFAQARGIDYPLLIGDDPAVELLRTLGNVVGAIPFTAVVDAQGRIVKTHPGEWAPADLEGVIQPLL